MSLLTKSGPHLPHHDEGAADGGRGGFGAIDWDGGGFGTDSKTEDEAGDEEVYQGV